MDKTNEGGIKNVAVSNSIKNGNAEVHVILKHFAGNTNADRALYNVDGNQVPRFPELAVKSAGFIDDFGCPHPMYREPDENTDSNGFDLHFPIIKDYHVSKGTILIRFGRDSGRFLSVQGTRFEELAIGLTKDSLPYQEYIVATDHFYVTKGIVAPQPQFGTVGKGGGIQYMTDRSISKLLKEGELQKYNAKC